MFVQSLAESRSTQSARLVAPVTTCCRQENEHTKEVESMQLEIDDLHAQLTTLRNALAATQVKRLCLALCGALRVQLICICTAARFAGTLSVSKREGLTMAYCPRAQSGSSTLLGSPSMLPSTLLHVDSIAGSATSATSAMTIQGPQSLTSDAGTVPSVTSSMTIEVGRPSLTSDADTVPSVTSPESTPSRSRRSLELVPLHAPHAPAPSSKLQAPAGPAQRHSLDRGLSHSRPPRLLKPPPEVGEWGGGDGWEGTAHAKSISQHRSAHGVKHILTRGESVLFTGTRFSNLSTESSSVLKDQHVKRESVLFFGTQFSILYT